MKQTSLITAIGCLTLTACIQGPSKSDEGEIVRYAAPVQSLTECAVERYQQTAGVCSGPRLSYQYFETSDRSMISCEVDLSSYGGVYGKQIQFTLNVERRANQSVATYKSFKALVDTRNHYSEFKGHMAKCDSELSASNTN